MLNRKISIICTISSILLLFSCSNQKNTKTTRLYHEINTRYNIYFNAEQAYIDALEKKNIAYVDNLSDMIYMYPYYPDEEQRIGGFESTIDKCVKAIKLHSIQVKPERDPSKRGNIAYQEWLSQREFNPFLKNAWLLMAKAEYQSLDYLRSITTFSYITRLFKTDLETVAEARLWIVNAYLQMNWVYEAENALRQIELAGGVPESQKALYAEVYANFLIRSKKYEEAIPYLQTAVKNSSGKEAVRFKYLLGQLYAETGNRQGAYNAFGKVPGLTTPYEYALNAKLQQSRHIVPGDKNESTKMLSSLNKMAKPLKNEDYLDQIYYAIGNIYLLGNDTVKAIDNYSLAIQKSTRNGYDKAMTQVTLGDIFYNQRDYIRAQPLYPEALGILGRRYERYNELMRRSEVLDKLVVHAQAIHLQDSLQVLARMPEAERLEVINKIIENLREKEQAEKRNLARADWSAENPDDMGSPFPSQRPPSMPGTFGEVQNSFYFYNPQTITQGKTAFRRLWGNRKLEDNWRRKDKALSSFGDFLMDDMTEREGFLTDSVGNDTGIAGVQTPDDEERETIINNVYEPEFYLSQLPLTPDAMKESEEIVEDAYFNMGMIYKDDLFDFNLAIETFEMNMSRFPQTPNLEEIYYQLFLIYTQLENKTLADNYRARLLTQFADGNYAKTLSDPNYEWNLRNMLQIENALYDETYDAYLAGNVNNVRENYDTAEGKYSLSKLMPKFMFLNALTYAQTNEPEMFKNKLSELVEKYPDADVTPVALEMLKGVLSGKSLSAGGPARGMIWNIQFGGENIAMSDTITQFVDGVDDDYQVMLIFDSKDVQRNELLYNVADYNFSNFVLQTFDLSFSELTPFEILQISRFSSLKDVTEYTNKIFEENSLVEKLDSTIIIIPISTNNYNVLSRGKSLDDYFRFFEESYGEQMPQLIAYWDDQMTKAIEETEREPDITVETIISEEDNDKIIESENDIIEEIKPLEIILKPKAMGSDSIDVKIDRIEEGLESVISDKTVSNVIGGINDVNDTMNEIADNPVDGIKNLISSIKNKPKLTKEEKEILKEEEKLRKELEKEQKARTRAIRDSVSSIEKSRQDSIRNAEKEKIALEKAAQRAKDDALRDAAKAKADAIKSRQQELREKERARKEELKAKEKARNERLKEKERERKEKAKQREAERREREKLAREKSRSR